MAQPQRQQVRNDADRGITAEVRFARNTRKRLMSEHLFNAANDEDGNKTEEVQKRLHAQKRALIAKKFIDDLTEGEGDVSVTHVLQNRPQEVSFPYSIFLMAVLKDVLDVVGTITLIGITFTVPFSFLIAVVLFFWVRGKISHGWFKKKAIKWLWKRYVFMIIVESFPFFQIIPVTIIFILMVHYREKKVVKMFDAMLETMRSKGIPLN